MLRPIRRILPNLGGLDLSPLVLILLLLFLRQIIGNLRLATL
jgi:YggT family protein